MADNQVNLINIIKQRQTAFVHQLLASLLFSSEYHFMKRLGCIYSNKPSSINELSHCTAEKISVNTFCSIYRMLLKWISFSFGIRNQVGFFLFVLVLNEAIML